MKAVAALPLLLAGCGQSEVGLNKPSGQTEPEAEIRERTAEFEEAWNRHDAAAVASFWAEDGTLVSPEGIAVHGRDRIRALMALMLPVAARATIRVRSVHLLDPGIAFVDSRQEVVRAGSAISTTYSVVVSAVKKNGVWLWADVRPYPLKN